MAVRFFERSAPPPAPDAAARPAHSATQNGAKRGQGTAAQVAVVEQDGKLLFRLAHGVPEGYSVHTFTKLDDVDLGRFPASRPVVLVLGPSQADQQLLSKLGPNLRARPGAGAVLIVDQPSAEVLRPSLRAGIDDAVELGAVEQQLPEAIRDLIERLEQELAIAEAAREAEASKVKKGWVTTVFSPKGGVGKSVVSLNLATSLARETGKPSVVLDLDLQFGDAAVMLRLRPTHTIMDAISAGSLLDESLLESFLIKHDKSNISVLAAPTAPSDADQVDPAGMLRVLDLLRNMFANVIIDSPPHLSEVVLQAVAQSDTVVFVVALDVPSVKNARLGLQAFQLLNFPEEKVMLVINRADSKVHLAVTDIERALEMKVSLTLPSEAVVPRAVNQGSPVVLEYPKSRFALQIQQLAEMVSERAKASHSFTGAAR